MRVIAGALKRRSLLAPSGSHTRPTTDRVREALFSVLEKYLAFDGMDVLDLYAGSGALGIEALSRGARQSTFVENDRHAVQTLSSNLHALGLTDRSVLLRRDVGAFLLRDERPFEGGFDLILCDPPWPEVSKSVPRALVHVANWLRSGGVLSLEHASREPPPLFSGLNVVETRRWGDTTVSLYQRLQTLTGSRADSSTPSPEGLDSPSRPIRS